MLEEVVEGLAMVALQAVVEQEVEVLEVLEIQLPQQAQQTLVVVGEEADSILEMEPLGLAAAES